MRISDWSSDVCSSDLPFADLPKPLRLLKRGLRRHTNGDRIMMQVLAAVPIAGLEPVLVAVELVLESGSLSADHILNVVARLTSTTPPPCVETSRSEEHTSELQSLMRTSYAVFCLQNKKTQKI